MRPSDRYVKIVEWSEENGCYVGRAPGLVLGGCHGDDERKVSNELLAIVEEAIVPYEAGGRPLPPPTAGRISRTVSIASRHPGRSFRAGGELLKAAAALLPVDQRAPRLPLPRLPRPRLPLPCRNDAMDAPNVD